MARQVGAGLPQGGLDTKAFARALLAGWAGLTPEVVHDALDRAPKLSRIAHTVQTLHARGDHAVVVSMSPAFVVDHFAAYGFDVLHGSRFPALPLTEALDDNGILTFADKPRIVMEICARLGIALANVTAYGDSPSDVPLFEVAGRSVAVNADEHVATLATVSYRGQDLFDAYRLGVSA